MTARQRLLAGLTQPGLNSSFLQDLVAGARLKDPDGSAVVLVSAQRS